MLFTVNCRVQKFVVRVTDIICAAALNAVLSKLYSAKVWNWPFLEPVNKDEVQLISDKAATGSVCDYGDELQVPDYYDVIKNPISLREIRNRLDSGWYVELRIRPSSLFFLQTNAL